jgi:RNA polymerase sigma-70 factor (ECF subfamily)
MAPMEAPSPTDEALMQRYAAGEVAAFDELYGRYELPLWRYLLRHSGDRAAAEELAQDVWFTVAREAPRFRVDGRFTPWLYTLARNRLIDRLRTLTRHASLDAPGEAEPDTPLVELLADTRGTTPEQDLDRDEQGRAILAALEQLPQEQREAFVLQVDAGLSVEEIATITGTGFETAKSRLRYARERLKALLRDHAWTT